MGGPCGTLVPTEHTSMALPCSVPGQALPWESQPLTCPQGPSLLLSVVPLAGATGGRAGLPACGSWALLLCRPPCVRSFCCRRDKKAFLALADPEELPQIGYL